MRAGGEGTVGPAGSAGDLGWDGCRQRRYDLKRGRRYDVAEFRFLARPCKWARAGGGEVEGELRCRALKLNRGEGVGRPDGRDQPLVRCRRGTGHWAPLEVEAGVAGGQRGGRDDSDLLAALDLVAAARVGGQEHVGGNVRDPWVVVRGAFVDGADAVGVGRCGATVGRRRREEHDYGEPQDGNESRVGHRG